MNHSALETAVHEEPRVTLVSETKFQLIVNLKAARALGLTIPHSLLQRADEAIQRQMTRAPSLYMADAASRKPIAQGAAVA